MRPKEIDQEHCQRYVRRPGRRGRALGICKADAVLDRIKRQDVPLCSAASRPRALRKEVHKIRVTQPRRGAGLSTGRMCAACIEIAPHTSQPHPSADVRTAAMLAYLISTVNNATRKGFHEKPSEATRGRSERRHCAHS